MEAKLVSTERSVRVAQRIRERRRQTGVRQEELARGAHLSRSMVSKAERGNDIGDKNYQLLAGALDMTLEELIGEDEGVIVLSGVQQNISDRWAGTLEERLSRVPGWYQAEFRKLQRELQDTQNRLADLTAEPKFLDGEITFGNGKGIDHRIGAQDYVRFWLNGSYMEARIRGGRLLIYSSDSSLRITPTAANMVAIQPE